MSEYSLYCWMYIVTLFISIKQFKKISFPQVQTQLQLRHFHFWTLESLWCPHYTTISSLCQHRSLALALLSPAVVFVCSRRAAVALSAAAGTAAENKTASGVTATGTAAAGTAYIQQVHKYRS